MTLPESWLPISQAAKLTDLSVASLRRLAPQYGAVKAANGDWLYRSDNIPRRRQAGRPMRIHDCYTDCPIDRLRMDLPARDGVPGLSIVRKQCRIHGWVESYFLTSWPGLRPRCDEFVWLQFARNLIPQPAEENSEWSGPVWRGPAE